MIDADLPFATVYFLHCVGDGTSISLNTAKKPLDLHCFVSGKILKVIKRLLVGIIYHSNLMMYCHFKTPRTLPSSASPNSEQTENICKWSLFEMKRM